MPYTPPRHLRSRIEQGILVLTITEAELRGDKLAHTLSQELLTAVTQAKAKKIVLDFWSVKSVSSEAFRPLLLLRQTVLDKGGRLLLCNVSTEIRKCFSAMKSIRSNPSSMAFFDSPETLNGAIRQLIDD